MRVEARGAKRFGSNRHLGWGVEKQVSRWPLAQRGKATSLGWVGQLPIVSCDDCEPSGERCAAECLARRSTDPGSYSRNSAWSRTTIPARNTKRTSTKRPPLCPILLVTHSSCGNTSSLLMTPIKFPPRNRSSSSSTAAMPRCGMSCSGSGKERTTSWAFEEPSARSRLK